MRFFAIGVCGLLFTGAAVFGFVPPAGYQKLPDKFNGDTFAVSADGKVAVGVANFSGGATIRVYASVAAAAANASPIQTFTDPTFKAFGDFTFADNDTLLFSENADKDTV